jgi:endo-1,4-beta-xylanase
LSKILVRTALGLALTAQACSTRPRPAEQPGAASDSPATIAPAAADSLRAAYAGAFLIGASFNPGLSAAERELLFRQFNTVTPGNCLKPGPIHPAEDRYEFATADALVDMVRAHGLTVNGHTLIWHNQCPNWFFLDGDRPAGRELVLQRMRSHITTVVRHFAGRVQSWDVVNEAIGDDQNDLRQTKWLTAIGDDYIAEAFRAAHLADPRAELYYNDYSIERPAKREKTLRLIRALKQQPVPIHGVGIQGHWQLDRIPYQAIEAAIIAFHREGVKVMITELDIDVVPRQFGGADVASREGAGADPYAEGLPPEVQRRLADQYARLFALFVKHRDKISRVTFWGLHDGRSWLNFWPSRRTNHPLLWDRQLQPKPALAAVLAVAPPAR